MSYSAEEYERRWRRRDRIDDLRVWALIVGFAVAGVALCALGLWKLWELTLGG